MISQTYFNSTIDNDIASTRHRLHHPIPHHRNHRTLRAELTVRFPPFPLYEFAVIRNEGTARYACIARLRFNVAILCDRKSCDF